LQATHSLEEVRLRRFRYRPGLVGYLMNIGNMEQSFVFKTVCHFWRQGAEDLG